LKPGENRTAEYPPAMQNTWGLNNKCGTKINIAALSRVCIRHCGQVEQEISNYEVFALLFRGFDFSHRSKILTEEVKNGKGECGSSRL
jgi:hypothetical protein